MVLWPNLWCLPLLLLCHVSGTSFSLEESGGGGGGPGLGVVGQQPDGQQAPVAIVIMALARSGSTLLGQMFRQNKVGASIWLAAERTLSLSLSLSVCVCVGSRLLSRRFLPVKREGMHGRQRSEREPTIGIISTDGCSVEGGVLWSA